FSTSVRLFPPYLASPSALDQMAASTQQQEWRRSTVGITPLSVRPRAGQRRVKKYDVEGAAVAAAVSGAEASPPMAAGAQGKKDATDKSNELRVVVPGRAGAEGDGVTLAAAGAGRGGRVCSVCARASADYSCPRCLVGYCSSKCYKVHGSGCTEAFFRGHVERETRLREGDEVERGSGVKGPKAGRRASMVEVLRRIRITDRGGDGNGGDGPHAEEEEAGEDEDGELMFQPERLEALALALKDRGHTLPAKPSSSSAKSPSTAAGAAAAAATTASSANTVTVDAAVKVNASGGSKIGRSLPSSSS
ncbi:unnamed protein product, partial [Ectocarpus sp. 8 AP-2014]